MEGRGGEGREVRGQGHCPLPSWGDPLAIQGFSREVLGLPCPRASPDWLLPINLLKTRPNPPPHSHRRPGLGLHGPAPDDPSSLLPGPACRSLAPPPSTTQQPYPLFPLQPTSHCCPSPIWMFLPPTSISTVMDLVQGTANSILTGLYIAVRL